MPFSKVGRSGQITIPIELRRQVGIVEGDLLEVQAVGSHLILVPKKLIAKSQAYFWASAWQAAERDAQNEINEERIEVFETVNDLIADLHRQH